jgi:hypothetical protein
VTLHMDVPTLTNSGGLLLVCALVASDGWHETTDSTRDAYRSNARAALAAARKAGLL